MIVGWALDQMCVQKATEVNAAKLKQKIHTHKIAITKITQNITYGNMFTQ